MPVVRLGILVRQDRLCGLLVKSQVEVFAKLLVFYTFQLQYDYVYEQHSRVHTKSTRKFLPLE